MKRLTDDGVSRDFFGGGRGRCGTVSEEVAQRQRRRDDLSFLLEVQIIQTVASLRSGDDRHRLRGVMMMLLVDTVLHRDITVLLVGRLVRGRIRQQVNTADAYRHRRRAILETAALLPPPRAEDRDQARQRSYRLLASWNILTSGRSRGRLAWLVTSRQLHGSAFSAFTIATRKLMGSSVRF